MFNTVFRRLGMTEERGGMEIYGGVVVLVFGGDLVMVVFS